MSITFEKSCARCQNIYPLERFYLSGKRGRDYYCIECRKEVQKSPRVKEQLRAISARHREKHPEREFARQKLGREVRAGRITKLPCWCGETDVQAHHPDYSKPLVVVWLCRKHHAEHHLYQKREAQALESIYA